MNIGDRVGWVGVNRIEQCVVERIGGRYLLVRLPNGKAVKIHESSIRPVYQK